VEIDIDFFPSFGGSLVEELDGNDGN